MITCTTIKQEGKDFYHRNAKCKLEIYRASHLEGSVEEFLASEVKSRKVGT